jgi:uncharacterized protein
MKNIFLFATILFSIPAFADDIRSVFVRSEGEIKITPDIAYVSVETFGKAKDGKSAQSRNAAEMARVQKVLKDVFKVDTKDIQSGSYSVSPQYVYDNNKRVFTGYHANQSLTVKFRELAKVGDLADALISAQSTEEQGTTLGNISFDIEVRKNAEIKAMELAMKIAKERAEALAKFADTKIKGVRKISDSSVNVQPYAQRDMVMESAAPMMKGAARTRIEASDITVSSSVAVEYEIN